jgi:hypothetical protein
VKALCVSVGHLLILGYGGGEGGGSCSGLHIFDIRYPCMGCDKRSIANPATDKAIIIHHDGTNTNVPALTSTKEVLESLKLGHGELCFVGVEERTIWLDSVNLGE